MNRNQIQTDALVAWKNSGYKGTICLATGFGKTKVGVTAAGEYLRSNPEGSVTIVVPRINLAEREWPSEFIKWGYEDVLDKVSIKVINSIYDTVKSVDLLILDEVHKYFSPEFGKIFDWKYKYILGLTATPPIHRKDLYKSLQEKCPILYEKSLDEAVSIGAVEEYEVINVPVKFNKKELASYRKWDNKFKISFGKLSWLKKKEGFDEDVFKLAQRLIGDQFKLLDEGKWAKDFWLSVQKRKQLCYKAENKISKSLEIIKAHPEFRKWILFTKNTEFCDEIAEYLIKHGVKARSYHAKIKKRDETLEAFAHDEFDVIVSADALTEGYNLPSIDAGISVAGVSTQLTNIQQLGRTLRKNGKQVKFFNLYVKDSQEQVWVEKKTANLNNVSWIKDN